MKNGQTTWLNEIQVTAVKLDLEKNKHLDTSVQLPKTNLEKKLLVQQAMNILNDEIKELKQKVATQSQELIEAQPKLEFHDQVGESEGLFSIGVAAKNLGYGRNRLFEKLREEKIFFDTEPYQQYINQGYFEVKTTTENGYMQKRSFVTPKGLQWLQKRF